MLRWRDRLVPSANTSPAEINITAPHTETPPPQLRNLAHQMEHFPKTRWIDLTYPCGFMSLKGRKTWKGIGEHSVNRMQVHLAKMLEASC